MGFSLTTQNCPYCGKSYYRTGGVLTTCVYYPPIYKDGKNINPDRNTNEMSCECQECGKRFIIHWKNDNNGEPQIKVLKYEEREL